MAALKMIRTFSTRSKKNEGNEMLTKSLVGS